MNINAEITVRLGRDGSATVAIDGVEAAYSFPAAEFADDPHMWEVYWREYELQEAAYEAYGLRNRFQLYSQLMLRQEPE